ncbi:MAG: GGDEF domain-containing protein [Eubacteriales bacterium]|nr:GGDEF domain-containing protein [Eubacteriales bacterium]
MKKKKMVLAALCILICCITLLGVFHNYSTWSAETFNKLMYENQKAYTSSRKSEIIAKIESVKTTLRTVAAVFEQCSSEDEIEKLDSALNNISENEDIQAEGVVYYSFRDINIDRIPKEEKVLIEQLQKGESVISDIYMSEDDHTSFYGIAIPVQVNGVYTGFVRGMIYSDTLLKSSQSGFLNDETGGYLIHKNGSNALVRENTGTTNLYESLKKISEEPEKIDWLKKQIEEGEDVAVVQVMADGQPLFISGCSLPFNDWAVLNTISSKKINIYINDIVHRGRLATLLVILVTSVIMLFIFVLYYWKNREQRFEQKRAALIANFSDTALCEYDLEKDTLKCTSNITKMLLIPDIIIERFSYYIFHSELVYHDDKGTITKMLESAPGDGKVEVYELRLKSYEGDYRWYAVHVTALYEKENKQKSAIMKITDIAQAKEEVRGLVKKAEADVLTNLLNREAFKAKVEKQLDKGGYLFLLDLDNFKQVNDSYGHQAGDEILKMTAECMKNCFRAGDYLGRYGGDEFLVFMPGNTVEESVKNRAQALLNMIENLSFKNMPELRLSCSIGVASYDGGGFEALLKKADKVMYLAKESGRDAWFYE